MKIISSLFIFCCFLFSTRFSFAQYKVTFLVKQPSVLHKNDHLFIAGSFNGWDPGDKEFEIDTTKNGITVLLSQGHYEFKFTRGSWQKVETTSDGKGISNRVLKVFHDTTVTIQINGWSDNFDQAVSPEKVHTASANVKVIDTAFFIPQLNRTRRIWVYLPPDYINTKNYYPVLYMHDGQNLFDNATSYSGEWGIDEYLDSIYPLRKKEVIVVGIDNGLSKRMNEYNPYTFKQYGKGEGDAYVDFLVNSLKPFIDKNYRTLPNKTNTYIAGSSMGGLISFYAVLKYPAVFGGAGIFSPAFWTAPDIDGLVISKTKKINARLFFYAGCKEGDSMIPDMKKIEKEIKVNIASPLHEIIDADAKHNEDAWRKYFPAFYEWAIVGRER
ncbi:MAG: alpha/beta hydrolase-fold protein [Ginsengibacter sp.]